MKKIIVFLILCFISFLYAGFSVINTGSITPSWHSTVVTGDFDNDGNLDLILTGFDSGSTKISKIYQGNGSGNFSEINSGSLTAVSRSSSVSGDIDGDGKLDLILAGSSSNGLVTKIYKNTGGANFIEINSNTLTAVSNGCMALGDIDGDGDLDLILTGQDSSLTFVSKIYQNDGTGSFTEINSGSLTGVGVGSSVVLEDLNGNGHLDLVLNGQDSSSPSYYSGVYTNDGTGYFTEIQTLQGAAYGSLSSGDINNDGYADIILSGSFCGEYGADYDKNITYVYINDGTGHMSQTGSLFHAGESSTAMGDINNDGSLDLVVLGWNGTDGATIYMYTNDGTGNFTDTGDSFFPVSEGSLLFGDFDNDKDLDLVITGNNTSRIYQNTPGTANTVPGVPTVTAFQDVGGFWKFTWDYPGDDHTPFNLMRYQFVIGTMSGTYNYISSSIDYPRGQVSLGRGNHKQEYQTKIPTSQIIYVKIRAIDSAFAVGSYSAEFHSPIPQPKFYCIDSIYGTTNYISSPSIQCVITNYDYADYYMINENPTQPSTNLSAGWIPLSGGDKTTLVYTATNYIPNTNSPIYLWIKADEIAVAMGKINYVFLDTLGPDIGNPPTLNAVASNSISITKPATPSDAGVGTMYWTVIRSNAGVTKTLATNLLSANNITDTGLTPNTFYYYKTIFLDQYKNSGASSVSANIETLSAAPSLTFSRTLNVVNTNDNITMTNKSSDIAYYRYAYIQNSSYTVKIADSSWSNIALNSITNIVFPNEGNWWIHVLSYNHQGVAGYQSTFGPYRYFKEVLGNFGLQSSKDLVVNNGTDSVVIDNSAPLTNIYTGLPITDNHKFNINIISGTGVISGASISNGQYYCLSSGGNIHFNLSGTVINKVVIQVSAVDFPGMTANITILISPELEMNLAEPLKRILNPDDGDILQIYLPESRAGENIAIEIYDIKRQVLVYSDKKTYQAWKAIEWDLTTRKGKLLSDGVYGVILRGSNWTKELKFVISRWYK